MLFHKDRDKNGYYVKVRDGKLEVTKVEKIIKMIKTVKTTLLATSR